VNSGQWAEGRGQLGSGAKLSSDLDQYIDYIYIYIYMMSVSQTHVLRLLPRLSYGMQHAITHPPQSVVGKVTVTLLQSYITSYFL
jgi:hypothetical protein